VVHRGRCEAERDRFFACAAAPEPESPWWEKLLHHERLAAFLDHPYYPTARAKVGFGAEELHRYAPEFAPVFLLHWLAVPHGLLRAQGPVPPFWPSLGELGLPASLSETHGLLPVHPHTWAALDALPDLSGVHARAHRAPVPYLRVSPTLSVRTVVVLDAPEWHLKLPLRIRTLGTRNLRTIKPSTLADGARIQAFLERRVEEEPQLRGRVLFTDERSGAGVPAQPLLGYLARRYPSALRGERLVSVAGLAAPAADGRLVAEDLADEYFSGSVDSLFEAYVEATLSLHLRLWVRHGAALESNQQNSVLVLGPGAGRLRLLLKDNDAPRLLTARLSRHPDGAALVAELEDRRILCSEEDALAQMFLTITLQLNLLAPLAALVGRGRLSHERGCALIREHGQRVLGALEGEGEDVRHARHWLYEASHHPVKYLLTAATLKPKGRTGAADVNKFYGLTGPNPLLQARA